MELSASYCAPAIGYCPLAWGLGNRLNGILNHITKGEGVMFGWPSCGLHCGAEWEQLFSTPLNVLPLEAHQFPKSWNRLKFSYWFEGTEEVEEFDAICRFIRSLIPSDEVRERMIDIPRGTIGYHIRGLAPASRIAKRDIVKVPHGSFLACDSQLQRMNSPRTLQVHRSKSADSDQGRHLEIMLTAVADWFCLMQCDTIIEVGLPFTSYTSLHSTFTDCHRIVGKHIVNH